MSIYKSACDVFDIGNNDKSRTSDSLSIKIETKKYTSTENPAVFGPSLWFTCHNSSSRYPIKASPITSERMKGFILSIPLLTTCQKCKEHATAHIEKNYYKLDIICSGRKNLFNFFVDFHNYVNKINGKPIMSYEDAYKLYTSDVEVTHMSYE